MSIGGDAFGGAGVAPRGLAAGTRIGDFRIKRLLGEGAMGEVYLAQDLILGRRIALKLVKAGMPGDGLSRFMDEARATAAFSHPNIVTIHAVGEHDGRPFLALEYLDGESLRARLGGGPMRPRDALRVVRAIADAIAEAHRRKIVHADLKPENVVVPKDGRLRVVDFGLARLVGTATGAGSGTPAYMAPERWTGAVPTGAIDVWSLGVILVELVTGTRPYTAAQLSRLASGEAVPLPDGLHGSSWGAIAADCLSRDPAERPTAALVARRLGELLDPGAGVARERGPFPGLAAFDRADAAHYVGRQRELDALVEHMRSRPLIPITGPSGAGKSSFVQAALMPRLDEDGSWWIVSCRPGRTPFASLATALGAAVPPSATTEPTALALTLAQVAARRGAKLLIFVDQFEEAFTLAPADATAFCESLAMAAVADEPWRIVLTVRDDYLGRLAEAPAMRPHLGAVMALPPLSAADLEAAVTTPVVRAGYELDSPDLARRIARDVRDQPACLPLLQFACQALWDRRDTQTRLLLTREYDAMGGASGALATHAQHLVSQLSPEQARAARAVLLGLVHADGTRRPRSRRELLDSQPAAAGEVVDQLLEHRLLVASNDPDHDDASLELAHEALATAWPQLARWLDETHEQRALMHELEQASLLWQRRGSRDEDTWSGSTLGETMRRVEQWGVTLPSVPRAFLAAGIERQRRQRRRRRWIASGSVGALAAVAVIAVLVAITLARQEREAVRQQSEIRLAAADMGQFDLELEPYDWDVTRQQAAPPARRSALSWQLRGLDAHDSRAPGRLYTDDDLRRGAAAWQGGALRERVEARSGPTFLVVDRGDGCAPSTLFLRRLPGYAERGAARPIRIRVPTCQASNATLIDVPAGEFLRNTDLADASGAVDERVSLPGYAIDRTEVTRGAFAVYESMAALTGDRAAPAPHLDLNRAGGEWLPAVGVPFAIARAYCRYLGKDLPTLDQWQKAFRGGAAVADGANPAPDRLTPWIQARSPRPANLAPTSGLGDLAPVGSFPDDTSPYGVVDLAGNVSEWSLSRPTQTRLRELRAVLGASWDNAESLGFHRITWKNARPDGYLGFSLGLRCVALARRDARSAAARR